MPTSGVFSRVSRITVLFVEDDADLRFAYHSLTVGEGLGVELAADGHEAITLANILLPDVIVLDRGLPDLDGTEVARRLRASSRTAAIPIIIVSGDDSEEMEAAVRALGCEGHLLKPCSADDLFRLIGMLAIRSRDPEGALSMDAIGRRSEIPLAPESHARLSPETHHCQGAPS